MKPADVIKLIKDKEVKYADLRFTDTRGKEQHVTIPANLVDEELFRDGKMFDGSSIAGWKGINESDMQEIVVQSTKYPEIVVQGSRYDYTSDIVLVVVGVLAAAAIIWRYTATRRGKD